MPDASTETDKGGATFSLPAFDEASRPSSALTARRLVYLDTNAWIELAEKKKDLAAACLREVENGTALFPLSYPTISELIEQPVVEQRRKVAELMDRLSAGVSFRPFPTIRLLEMDRAFRVLLGQPASAPEPSVVLSWIIEYVGTASVTFDPSWNAGKAREFIEHFKAQPAVRSVCWIVDHAPIDSMATRHDEAKVRYVDALTASIQRGAEAVAKLSGAARKARLLREEREWVVNKIMAPRFTKTLLDVYGIERLEEAVKALSAKLGEGNDERFATLMTVAPSVDLWCEIMAERVANMARRVRPQDLHDVDHALIGAVYANIFVTRDRGLVDLITQRCTVARRRGVTVAVGVDALAEHLQG
jgi:predicted nucleic acid-binding protein